MKAVFIFLCVFVYRYLSIWVKNPYLDFEDICKLIVQNDMATILVVLGVLVFVWSKKMFTSHKL